MQAINGRISEKCRFEESTEFLRNATTLCPAKSKGNVGKTAESAHLVTDNNDSSENVSGMFNVDYLNCGKVL
jgi:hypothetical protein